MRKYNLLIMNCIFCKLAHVYLTQDITVSTERELDLLGFMLEMRTEQKQINP
jgi:hypothetical protein